ncbi:glycosyltransferase family 2 protein [Amazonocrinis nigriterrae]|nr:glycosyltransferase family 2 protein [Amazonocrinis nigriterrae]
MTMTLELQSHSVSILICTCNRAESLRHTLESLAQVNVPENLSCELIVVDNASSDRTAEIIQSFSMPNMPVRYISELQRGLSKARNAGIAAARGEIILFTDDDVRPPHNWIEGMCAPILAGTAEAVAGGVKIAPHLDREWMQPIHRAYFASSEFIDPQAPQFLIGANMAFLKQVLVKIPGFDTEIGPGAIGYGDDTLFTAQILQAGYRIASALDVVVEHHFDESRLLRSHLMNAAQKAGQTSAYLAHHWDHTQISFPRLRLLKCLINFGFWRLKTWRHPLKSEGLLPQEWELIHIINFYKQYLVEWRRKPNYQQYGLVKNS